MRAAARAAAAAVRLTAAGGRHASSDAPAAPGRALAAVAPLPPTPRLADLLAASLPGGRGAPAPAHLAAAHTDDEWECVVFAAHAPPRATTASAASLGLAPRDASLFRPAPPGGGAPQRATLAARSVTMAKGGGGDATLILFRTEAVRAAVGAETATIFPCRRPADTASLLTSVNAAVAAAGAPFAPPFELAVLEAALAETVRQFERRARQLRSLAAGVEDDLARSLRGVAAVGPPPAGELGRLLPLARALVEVGHDVREARAAVEDAVNSDRTLASLCLTVARRGKASGGGGDGAASTNPTAPPSLPGLRTAEALLESYERQLHSVEGSLKETGENLESARAAFGAALDAARNRTLSISLHVSVASAAVAVACGAPAAFLGMNVDLPSSLSSGATAFPGVVAGCTAAAATLYLGLAAYLRRFPLPAHRRRAADARALADLLAHHLDDLDAILASVKAAAASAPGGRLAKPAFGAAVAAALGGPMRADELEILFRVHDADASGFLEAGEVVAASRANGEGGWG